MIAGEEFETRLADGHARAEVERNRADRAEVALAKYARHLDGCSLVVASFSSPGKRVECSCGLRRALKGDAA